MGENIEVKDVQKTEYLDKNGLDMLWAKVKENTRNQVEVESNRAVKQETIIIETKADKSEFSNYVPSATFTALEKKVSANTANINNKQDAGNYLHYETLNNEGYYEIPSVCIPGSGGSTKTNIDSQSISINDDGASCTTITPDSIVNRNNDSGDFNFTLDRDGLKLEGGDDFSVLTSNGSTIDITQYAKKTEVSDFISKTTTNDQSIESRLNVSKALTIKGDNNEHYAAFLPTSDNIQLQMVSPDRNTRTYLDPSSLQISKSIFNITITANGISKSDGSANYVYATDGSIADLTQYAKASALNSYVLTTALDKQVDTLNAAINGKQDAGNYIPYKNIAFKNKYVIEPSYSIEFRTDTLNNKYGKAFIGPQTISITSASGQHAAVEPEEISVRQSGNASGTIHSTLNADSFGVYNNNDDSVIFKLNQYGIKLEDGDNNHVLTSNASTIDITQYVLKSVYDEKIAALEARIAALEAKHTETA